VLQLESGLLVPFGVPITGIAVFTLYRRGVAPWRLLVVVAFAVYLGGVASETLFPVELGGGAGVGHLDLSTVHLEPFKLLADTDVQRRQALLNVILGIPFGILVPLMGHRRWWVVAILGLLFAVAIESLQLLEDLLAGSAYRTVDVNDVILNWLGVIIGLACFLVAAGLMGHRRPRGARTAA
jgi:glycopeptide antibiotics resistance protein